MKIIGEAGDSVIIYATKDEFARLAGFYSDCALGRDGVPAAKAGAVLPVSQMYDQARELIGWYKEFKDTLVTNQKRLTKMLEVIDPAKMPTDK